MVAMRFAMFVLCLTACGEVVMNDDEPQPIDVERGYCDLACEGATDCGCLDFDGPDAKLPFDWQLVTNGGSYADPVIDDRVTAPRAYRMFQAGSTTGDIGSTFTALKHAINTQHRKVRFEYDWKLEWFETRERWSNFQLATVGFAGGGAVALYYILDPVNGDSWSWGYGKAIDGELHIVDRIPVPPPPTSSSKWCHVRVEVDFQEGTRGSLAISYDDVEVARKSGIAVTSPLPPFGVVTATVGIGTLQGLSPDVSMAHDNVVLAVE